MCDGLLFVVVYNRELLLFFAQHSLVYEDENDEYFNDDVDVIFPLEVVWPTQQKSGCFSTSDYIHIPPSFSRSHLPSPCCLSPVCCHLSLCQWHCDVTAAHYHRLMAVCQQVTGQTADVAVITDSPTTTSCTPTLACTQHAPGVRHNMSPGVGARDGRQQLCVASACYARVAVLGRVL